MKNDGGDNFQFKMVNNANLNIRRYQSMIKT